MTLLTQNVVKYVGWGTGCVYLVGSIIIALMLIITFPGKYTAEGYKPEYLTWFYGQF